MLIRFVTWVADRLLGGRAARAVRQVREATPAVAWQSLREAVGRDLDGYTLFVEMRDDTLRPARALGLDPQEIVGLAAAWLVDGEIVSSEPHARELEERLSERTDISATLLMNRDPETFAGFYVRLRPRTASDDSIPYNGTRVHPDWPARVDQAQRQSEYVIGGVTYPRIRYGDEQYVGELEGPVPEPCHDCAVRRGQYHVGPLCDMEECPRCRGQVIACDCPYEDDAK